MSSVKVIPQLLEFGMALQLAISMRGELDANEEPQETED
jgi:hypothetical protein